jgi:mono/diheme cytochrome c family protein
VRRRLSLIGLILGLGGTGLWLFLSGLSIGALDKPGRLETALALRAKRWLVGRAAAGVEVPPATPESVTIGGMQFRGRCASCHGIEGRTPTDLGSAMYPPALDLGGADVQAWSDAEMFWIIKNGIRFTGMPGFGRALSDEEIWPLVRYIRTLPGPSGEDASTRLLPEGSSGNRPRFLGGS